jgi:ethanolamine utilization protein EutP (predicted NTPase)
LEREFGLESLSLERVALAKKVLGALDINVSDEGSLKYSLLEEVLRRCIQKEDIAYINLKLGDVSSQIVYILTANAKGLATEHEILSALRALLESAPSDSRSWALARHLRSSDRGRENKVARAVLLGPRASGKTSLLMGLYTHCLTDPRFQFPESSFNEFPTWYSMSKTLSTVATFEVECYELTVVAQRFPRPSATLQLWDSPGELMAHLQAFEAYEFQAGDSVFLTFNAAVEDREGKFSWDQQQYLDVRTWAIKAGYRIIPILTKTDLLSESALDRRAREIEEYFEEPLLVTSCMNGTGIDTFADTLVRSVI